MNNTIYRIEWDTKEDNGKVLSLREFVRSPYNWFCMMHEALNLEYFNVIVKPVSSLDKTMVDNSLKAFKKDSVTVSVSNREYDADFTSFTIRGIEVEEEAKEVFNKIVKLFGDSGIISLESPIYYDDLTFPDEEEPQPYWLISGTVVTK